MSQSQEKRFSKGQMEKLGHFELLPGERNFSQKNSTPTVLSTSGSSTSCTMSEKANDWMEAFDWMLFHDEFKKCKQRN